jgi:hypothetical protein
VFITIVAINNHLRLMRTRERGAEVTRLPKECQAVPTEDIFVYADDFDNRMMIEIECTTEGNNTPVNVKLRLGTKQIKQLKEQITGKFKLKRVEEKLEYGTLIHYACRRNPTAKGRGC